MREFSLYLSRKLPGRSIAKSKKTKKKAVPERKRWEKANGSVGQKTRKDEENDKNKGCRGANSKKRHKRPKTGDEVFVAACGEKLSELKHNNTLLLKRGRELKENARRKDRGKTLALARWKK